MMTREEAYKFLRTHQPLPDDDVLTEGLATTFDEVIKYFVRAPESDAIPLLLNAFGEGDGFGTYQLVEDVFYKFQKADVLPHLLRALTSSQRPVRFWAAEIAANFPDDTLVGPLANLLKTGDDDTKMAAATALSQIRTKASMSELRAALGRETDPDVVSMIQRGISHP